MRLKFEKLSHLQVEQLPCSLTFHLETSLIIVGDVTGCLHCYHLLSGEKLAVSQWHKHSVVAIGYYQNRLYSFDRLQNLVSGNLNNLQRIESYSLTMQGNLPGKNISSPSNKYKKGDLIRVSYSQLNKNGQYTKLVTSIPLWTVATARFTHSGQYLIFGVDAHPRSLYGGFSKLYQIDVATASLVKIFDWEAFFSCRDVGSIDAIAISRDDRQLVASGLDVVFSSVGDWSNSGEYIYQWNIDDGSEICCYECDRDLDNPNSHQKISPAFSPDNRQLLVSCDAELSLWKVTSSECRHLFVSDEDCKYLESFPNLYGVFDWSPQSNIVAFGSPEGILRFIDLVEDKILLEQEISQSAIQQVCFSDDGKFLAVYSEDLTFEIWYIDGCVGDSVNSSIAIK